MPVRIIQLKKKTRKSVTTYSNNPGINDTTHAIWCETYRVKMNELESRSIADIKFFGVRSSGNKRIDDALRNQHVYRYISIEKMVEYNEQSCLMGFTGIDDLKKIYQALHKHMVAWKNALGYGVNIYGAPVTDLLAMDRFSDAIWSKICYYVNNKDFGEEAREHYKIDSRLDIRALFANSMLKELGIAPLNSNVQDYIGKDGKFDTHKLPRREGFKDFFESKLDYM